MQGAVIEPGLSHVITMWLGVGIKLLDGARAGKVLSHDLRS